MWCGPLKTYDPVANAAAGKKWREANPEYGREAWKRRREDGGSEYDRRGRANQARYRLRHPARTMLAAAKARAAKKGIEFSITVADITVPEVCPYLGLELVSHAGTGQGQADSPSLDRINPERGYVPGNVEVISLRANTLKGDATADELTMIATRLEDLTC